MDFLVAGGSTFTIPILLMGIAIVVVFIWQLILKLKGGVLVKKRIDLILFLGSFSFLYAIFGQILGLYQAAGVIQEATEIAPALIWGGLRVSFIAPIMGFVVLLVGAILWFVLKPGKGIQRV